MRSWKKTINEKNESVDISFTYCIPDIYLAYADSPTRIPAKLWARPNEERSQTVVRLHEKETKTLYRMMFKTKIELLKNV